MFANNKEKQSKSESCLLYGDTGADGVDDDAALMKQNNKRKQKKKKKNTAQS